MNLLDVIGNVHLITRQQREIARAQNVLGDPLETPCVSRALNQVPAGSLLTLRDRQTIEVLPDGDAPELFVVIAMVALHLDHRDEKRRRKRAESKKDDL